MFDEIPGFIQEYLPILVFIIFAGVISCVLVAIPAIFAENKPSHAKNTPFECGFDAFSDSRAEFDVRFYLVAILFIIFDLEIIFLFPWSITLGAIGMFGFWSMMVFLFILLVGFIYEWRKGALDWE